MRRAADPARWRRPEAEGAARRERHRAGIERDRALPDGGAGRGHGGAHPQGPADERRRRRQLRPERTAAELLDDECLQPPGRERSASSPPAPRTRSTAPASASGTSRSPTDTSPPPLRLATGAARLSPEAPKRSFADSWRTERGRAGELAQSRALDRALAVDGRERPLPRQPEHPGDAPAGQRRREIADRQAARAEGEAERGVAGREAASEVEAAHLHDLPGDVEPPLRPEPGRAPARNSGAPPARAGAPPRPRARGARGGVEVDRAGHLPRRAHREVGLLIASSASRPETADERRPALPSEHHVQPGRDGRFGPAPAPRGVRNGARNATRRRRRDRPRRCRRCRRRARASERPARC